MANKKAVVQNKGGVVEKAKFMSSGNPFVGYNIAGNYLGTNTFINKQQLYELYRSNTDIRQGVRKIAQYVGNNGIKLKDKVTGEYISSVEDKEIIQEVMFVLSNPTYLNTKIEIIKHLIVSGELYLLPTKNGLGDYSGLQIIDPRTITKHIENGMVVGFTQSNSFGGPVSRTFTGIQEKATDSVPLLRYYQLEKHINNEIYGMGLLEGVVRDSLSDLEASKRNYYFFQNDMTPPSIFMMDPDLSETEQQILVDQLKETYSTPKNAHKPLMGVGVKDVKQLSISPKDMEHIKQRQMTTEKVCSAIGVPKNMLGYVDNVNLSNGEILMKEFLEGTIDQRDKFLEHIINDFYQTYFEDFGYYIELDGKSATDTYKETDDLIKRIDSGLLTVDEARGLQGKDAYAMQGFSDVPLIKKDKSLLTDVGFDMTGIGLPG